MDIGSKNSQNQGNRRMFESLFTIVKELQEECQSVNAGNINAIQNQLDNLHIEQESISQLSAELARVNQQLEQVEAEKNELLKHYESQSDAEIQKKLFQQCCGLEFRVTSDKAVSLVYNKIHPSQPDKKYSVTLDIVEEGPNTQSKWTLVGVDPMITGIRPLVEDLNSTNDFHQFCLNLRKRLQAHQRQQTNKEQ